MSNEERALLSSKTEKKATYSGTSPEKNRENKSLKGTLTDIEQEEQKLSDKLKYIHSVCNGIIRNMQYTSVKLE